MTTDLRWHTTLSHHFDDMWLELVNVVRVCTQENLVAPKVAKYELLRLNDRLSDAKANSDPSQLEESLEACKRVLTYYTALRRQKQRADHTGSTFSRLALERLKQTHSL